MRCCGVAWDWDLALSILTNLTNEDETSNHGLMTGGPLPLKACKLTGARGAPNGPWASVRKRWGAGRARRAARLRFAASEPGWQFAILA